MNTTENAQMTDEELLVLFKRNPEIAKGLLDMTNKKAKKMYVDSKHNMTIAPINSKNPKLKGYWSTHVTVDGKRKAVLKASEDKIYEYLYDFYQEQENKVKTYEEVLNMFIESKRAHGRSEATIKEYIRINAFLPTRIKQKDIALVTEDELRTWFTEEYLSHKPKKEAMTKMLQLLRAVFSFGIQKKFCFSNPVLDINPADYAKFCNLTTKSNEERSFSEEEIDKLRHYCLKHQFNPHAAVMLVAMETGMRSGELVALRKTDILDGYIWIHRQQVLIPKTEINKTRHYSEVEYTKNERTNPRGGRIVPITQRCQEALNIAYGLDGESEYLFHHPSGKCVFTNSYEAYLRRVCAKLGIETSHNHAFRVAFNARLIQAGVDGNERCLVLGHSMQTNERHYSFSDKRKAEDVRNKLNSIKPA